MPHAVTMPLDPEAARPICAIWRALADQAGSDGMLRLGYPPHLTLAVLPDVAEASALEGEVWRVVADWAALPLTLAGFGIFPGDSPVLWAAPVATARLLERHVVLCAALARFGLHPHYAAGHWVPHVTLSQDGAAPIERLAGIATALWRGPVQARLERVELVRFPPVAILGGRDLPQGG